MLGCVKPMKCLAHLFLAAGLASCLGAAEANPADTDANVTVAADSAAETKPAPRKLVLAKGVAAEAILKAYGQPFKILPVTTPDPTVKAERWIYRRKLAENVWQEVVNDRTETYTLSRVGATGADVADTIRISNPIMATKRSVTYQITNLLIVNGRLEMAKQSKVEEESIQ